MVGSVLQAVMGGAKKETEFADQKALAKDAARTRRDVNKWWIKYERHKGQSVCMCACVHVCVCVTQDARVPFTHTRTHSHARR
jgi:hypothetical protein